MKTFNSLPEVIHRKGKVYKVDVTLVHAFATARDVREVKKRLHDMGKTFITVHVLARNLKGKTDLYGQPYKPSTWLFVEQ